MTKIYPVNRNSSELGITTISNIDGCITEMMYHPERVF
ncbi:phosphoribosylformylglycinamidine synthase subunit PurQ [Haemophilus haemolyticus]|uniref:Phosphoribosylformylglycinamidine synthase subunit PurQ n=1 Tax=Haemophilus haemolyticus TaxID=726 RepID=A0A852Q445_HAEHA|nr:phosphoribosylformylglycinamidine synthase subunit PurQ [Haemophilus haemolyticus]